MEKKIIIGELKGITNEFMNLLENNTKLEIDEFKKYLAVNKKIWDLQMKLIDEEYKIN